MAEVSTYRFAAILSFMLAAAWVVATELRAEHAVESPEWIIEQGTDRPSYAAVEPIATNLNIDMVVLACEETWDNPGLQLRVYLTDDGPLAPNYLTLQRFKIRPRAAISIDRQTFPAALLFAGEYAVLADVQESPFPLSDALLEAIQTGNRMTLHFDLLEESAGEAPSFDGWAIVNLGTPGSRQAVAAMRGCASTPLHLAEPHRAWKI